MDAVRVEKVSKNFEGLQVFSDLSFALNPGERWALIGPNGAGKSTLLNILSGVLPATSGRIWIEGEDVTKLPVHERLRRGLSRSFQMNTLFPQFTVRENIVLALGGKRSLRHQLFQRIKETEPGFQRMREMLKSVGLWDKRDLIVGALSYGEQRQMEIALSLASEPKILLLDEPSAGLSDAESTEMVKMIRGITEGSTLLFSAHDMDVVFSLADRIMVLGFGKIVAQGTCFEIQCNSLVREIYLGSE
jgi:branched-chain amino acid transport system ATP-binding protein